MNKKYSQWGILWRSNNWLDGETEHLIFDPETGLPRLFRVREKARQYARDHYGYIRKRKDLHDEPHGWKYPTVVRVDIKYSYWGTGL